jgi:hypothetical protein
MDTPYRVEKEFVRVAGTGGSLVVNYLLTRAGDAQPLVKGNDLLLMHHICDLLNDDANGKDVHR